MDWLGFAPASFAKAKREKKPILLCVSASWCHWCHTMDKLTYSDKDIAAFIKKNFVPIRVDTDERPDINERYNVGGWPSTVILAPDGEPVSGATYVSPQNMLNFLNDALLRFKKYVPKLREAVSLPNVKVDPAEFWPLVESFYDPVNGGFGLEPKFPHHDILEYLIWHTSKGSAKAAKMLDHSLHSMLNSEFFDKEGGGFFRYASLQNWTIPHFEKMLEDNARLLVAYCYGFKLFGRKEYLVALNKTLAFVFSLLFDSKSKLFYSSQDADEGYCTTPFLRRLRVGPPAIDRRFFTDSNALMVIALFELSKLEPGYRDLGLDVLESLWTHSVKNGVFHSKGGVQLFRDAIFLLAPVVFAYETTKDKKWKSRTHKLLNWMERFEAKDCGYYDVLQGEICRLKERKKQVVENSVAAFLLRKLAKLENDSSFDKKAKECLDATASIAWSQGAYGVLWALASLELKS